MSSKFLRVILTLAICSVVSMCGRKKAHAQNADEVVDDPKTEMVWVPAPGGEPVTVKHKPGTKIVLKFPVNFQKDDPPPVPVAVDDGASEQEAVPPEATIDPFPPQKVVETSKYDFGGGLFANGFVLLQPRDDRDGYDESVEELMTGGLVGTLSTKSLEWSVDVGVGGCGKREVAATAGAALLYKQGEHFGLGPTVNLSFCSNVDDPDEELVQLRVVDTGLRLAGNWKNFGMFADVVGTLSTEPLYIGRSTEFGLGVRLGVRTGWF